MAVQGRDGVRWGVREVLDLLVVVIRVSPALQRVPDRVIDAPKPLVVLLITITINHHCTVETNMIAIINIVTAYLVPTSV